MDRLARPDEFAARAVELRAGAFVDPVGLAEQLLQAGYEPEPLVEEPGQFSRRGGIVDVFPPTEAAPIRIEFFGDEVESVRSFDPLTQRSRDQLGQCRIGPATELFASAERATRRAAGRAGRLRRSRSRPATPGSATWTGSRPASRSRAPRSTPARSDTSACSTTCRPRGLLLVDEPEGAQAAVEQIEAQAAELYAELEHKRQLPAGPAPAVLRLGRAGRRRSGGATASTSPGGPSRAARTARDEPDRPGAARPGRAAALGAAAAGPAVRRAAQGRDRRRRGRPGGRAADRDPDPAGRPPGRAVRRAERARDGRARLPEPPPGGLLTLVQGSGHEGFQLAEPAGRRPGPADRPGGLRLDEAAPAGPGRARSRATRFLCDLEAGDYVVHVEHGIGRFGGLVRMASRRRRARVPRARVRRRRPAVRAGRPGRPRQPLHRRRATPRRRCTRLGSGEWERAKRARRAGRARRWPRSCWSCTPRARSRPGTPSRRDTPWQRELEASFPYARRPTSCAAIADVKPDMESAAADGPPDLRRRRLRQDRGGAARRVQGGRWTASRSRCWCRRPCSPQQHFNTFRERLAGLPGRGRDALALPHRQGAAARSSKGWRRARSTSCIGTHRLLQKDVEFKDLGLVVIDEEQRFGVTHKERLKQLRTEVDVLTLTATPIPRTLHMALVGVRDISMIETPPRGPPADRAPTSRQYDDGLRARGDPARDRPRRAGLLRPQPRARHRAASPSGCSELVPEARIVRRPRPDGRGRARSR